MGVPSSPPSRRRPLLAVALGLAAALLAAELVVRLAPERFGLPPSWNSVQAGAPDFEARPHLLYTHRPADPAVNERGFLGAEWPGEKGAGVLRVLCLGASTTEVGNDGGPEASYPFFLERGLNPYFEGSGESVEVVNLGLAGWTTAETLVHWFLAAKDLEPDLVLIHHAANDVAPRMWPGFRSDYAHYRRPWSLERGDRGLFSGSALVAAIAGAPPTPTLDDAVVRPKRSEVAELAPAGRAAFRRNVESIARDATAQGARVALVTLPIASRAQFGSADLEPWRMGIAEHNDELRSLCAQEGYLLIDLAAEAEAGHELLDGAFIDLVHVDADGNLWKALAIGAALAQGWEPFARVAQTH
ncbi:SGNH/GDSL hydrolase family protein [Engelhardtia mirabilis]|uniref:SGNH hydrolase-type esterase domain-containing protein n=1 Tax=Engelhardtia mirabilis TaxID=2528011 RepID=A0A518BP38_9BACT|nr:hypothetical protein Pla133_38440 [Planctomycetes bacterium Pla133]QDV03068.1 hypothetical protein Pla86_38430 [Planctomycetes bacterium Pla86]